MRKTKPAILKTHEVRERLGVRYKEPAWVMLEEVRNRTGFSSGGRERYADALALSLYPSRGIELHGFEIKVSRSDVKKELDDPEKALAFSRYCARWYLVVGRADLIADDELPPNWGLLVPHGTGLKLKRKAKPLDPKPWPPGFVASMVRCASAARPSKAELQKARKEGEEQGGRWVRSERDRAQKELAKLEERVQLFNKHSGVDLTRYTWDDKVKDQAELFKQLRELDVEQFRRQASRTVDRLQTVVDHAREALAHSPQQGSPE